MQKIRFGIEPLDSDILEGDGLPPKSLVEISGEPNCGKTFLCLHLIKEYQEENADNWAALIATEHLSLQTLDWLNIDKTRLLVAKPNSKATGLELAKLLVEEGCPLIVLDSIATTATDTGDENFNSHVREVSIRSAFLKIAMSKSNSTVVFTNQERKGFGGRYTTGTSAALLRLTDVRINLDKKESIYKAGKDIGVDVDYQIIKNGLTLGHNPRGRIKLYWHGTIKGTRKKSNRSIECTPV